jgi:hypothetical protein
MMTRHAQVLLITAVVAAGTAMHPSAALAQGNQPRTQLVTAIFSGAPVNARTRTCVGADGTYLEIRGAFSGTIISSDPRLTGTIDFMAEPALVNLMTGLGTFDGRFRVSAIGSGKQTAEGQFFTVVTEGSLNHGFALGQVMNNGNGASDRLFAAFQSTIDGSLNVSGQLGAAGDPRTPAVVQSGQCSGPFTQVP